jgi:hypothetical protein
LEIKLLGGNFFFCFIMSWRKCQSAKAQTKQPSKPAVFAFKEQNHFCCAIKTRFNELCLIKEKNSRIFVYQLINFLAGFGEISGLKAKANSTHISDAYQRRRSVERFNFCAGFSLL